MKNTINIIKNKKAKFTDGFCAKKFDKSKKCYEFYMSNFQENYEGIKKCPYGYVCYFYKNQVISSIVDDTYADLKCILSREKFINKYNKGNDYNIKILSKLELQSLIDNNKKQYELDIYRDAFHDLNNNNRSLKDIVEKIEDLLSEQIKENLKKLFDIFDKHNETISFANDVPSKLEIYSSELLQIDKIKSIILKKIPTNKHEFYRLKSNLEFIDYRIRYLNRIVEDDYHSELYKKELDIVKIISKLKYAFTSTLIKKGQSIIIEKNDNEDIINLIAYDDLYLGFFILFENAIKYAPMNSNIIVNISCVNECINISIENESKNIEETGMLITRGFQGNNHKDGNGLGLSIAYDIFCESNLSFSVEYLNSKFVCKIQANDVRVLSK